MSPLPTTDLDALARTIDGEADGEPVLGRQAVAAVIANRLSVAKAYCAERNAPRHPTFGEPTWRGVCLASWRDVFQFSCWEAGSADRRRILETDPPQAIVDIALSAIDGTLADPTDGALWYLNVAAEMEDLGHLPGWVQALTETVKIGHHTFYKAAR
jgi:spore germination cell wall hydrolase CwlJ-like protein